MTLLARSATELAQWLRIGEISSTELITECLERIESENSRLHAFVAVMEKDARWSARKADERLVKWRRGGRSGELPPFLGVPTGVKDLDFCRGTFTRLGSRAYHYFYSPFDGFNARRLRQGGFVILGKLATSEFGAMPIVEPDTHPATRNPWNPEHSPGGSSGGTGAAVGGFLLPIAPGSDGAGSIRIPSAFCHLYGLKPSHDLLPKIYGPSDALGLATAGPMAHTVEDAAGLLSVLSGKRFHEPRLAPGTRLKIRFLISNPLIEPHPDITAGVIRAAKLFEEMGHDVAEGQPPELMPADFLPIWERMMANIPVIHESLLQPVTRWLRENGRRYSASAIAERKAMLELRLVEWFNQADIWLTPTVSVFPPKVGEWKDLGPAESFGEAAKIGAYTAMYNIIGYPAASVPMGFSAEKLPFGLQVGARKGRDELVLAVSRQLEEAFPWFERARVEHARRAIA